MELTKRARARAAEMPTTTPRSGEPCGLAQDHGADLVARGLRGRDGCRSRWCAGDGVGHDAVDADAGEGESEDAEAGGEGGEDALLLQRWRRSAALGADVRSWAARGRGVDGGAEAGDDGVGVGGCGAETVRPILGCWR